MIRTPPPQPLDMQFSSIHSISPSFTNHSSNNLADIAARVVEEFRNQNRYQDDDNIYFVDDINHVYVPEHNEPESNRTETESDSDEEFEFAVVRPDHNSLTDDSFFFNGEIMQRYPLFDRSLLQNDVVNSSDSKHVRQPLKKLFEHETATCYDKTLENVTPGTYCIWKPKTNSVTNCKKSNSTGSGSKRWRFRNLLHRSNSDISASRVNNSVIVFRHLTAKKKRSDTAKVAGADDDGEPVTVADEVKAGNKNVKEGNRRRSYPPYKQDLVGVFGNVNEVSRKLHPF